MDVPLFGKACVSQLLHLVLQAKQLLAQSGAKKKLPELEIRFGHITSDNRRVEPGLSTETIEPVFRAFANSKCWNSTVEWQRSHVFHYNIDGQEYRSETVFEENGLRTTTLRKTKINKVDLGVAANKQQLMLVGVRVALATEDEVPAGDLPPYVYPSQVHIKHRRTFLFGSGDKPVWSYTFTRRWSGDSLESVYALLNDPATRIDPPVELEIECIDYEYFISRSAEHLAGSILCKIHDIVQRLDPSLQAPESFMLVAL